MAMMNFMFRVQLVDFRRGHSPTTGVAESAYKLTALGYRRLQALLYRISTREVRIRLSIPAAVDLVNACFRQFHVWTQMSSKELRKLAVLHGLSTNCICTSSTIFGVLFQLRSKIA